MLLKIEGWMLFLIFRKQDHLFTLALLQERRDVSLKKSILLGMWCLWE